MLRYCRMSELSERYRERAKVCRRLAAKTDDIIAGDSLTGTAEDLEEAAKEEEEREEREAGERHKALNPY